MKSMIEVQNRRSPERGRRESPDRRYWFLLNFDIWTYDLL